MPERVFIFIDSQNTYMGARETFFTPEGENFPRGHHSLGQYSPLQLGQLLTSKRPPGFAEQRALVDVRVYTGVRIHERTRSLQLRT